MIECPKCGATNYRSIVYGYPSHEVMDLSRKGSIKLGGCIIDPGSPDFVCNCCGTEWRVRETALSPMPPAARIGQHEEESE